MNSYFVVLCAATFFGLTTISLDARKVPRAYIYTNILMDEASADHLNGTSGEISGDFGAPIPRQEEEERPYEYVPRVFHSLRKIIKGVLNGSIHEVFHGSFSFAPREVGNEIITVYNQVVGLPDATEPSNNDTADGFDDEEREES